MIQNYQINNSLYFLPISIVLSIIFFILFSILLFFYSLKEKKNNKIIPFYSIIIYIIFGICLGLVFPLSFFISKFFYNNETFPITLLSAVWVCSITFNKWISIGSFITFILCIFLFFPLTSVSCWLLIGAYILMIVIVFTSSFFKRFSHFAFASWQLVFFFIAIIVSISFFYNYAVSLTIYFSVFLVLNFIYYYSLFFASKFVNKLSWLGSNAYYENKHFLYQNFVSSFFYDDIKKKNINYALVAVFKINGLEEILHENGRRTYNEAKKNILTIIYNFFKSEKNISFFITSSGKPGIILTYDNLFNHKLNKSFDGNHLKERNEDDNLFFLERIINSLPNKLSLNGITKEIFINSYCSFYGIYSNDIDQIIDSLDKETSINIYKNNLTYVQLLDQIDNQKGLFDYSSISKLEKEINFLNINISLFETMSYNQNVLIPTFFYKNLLISSLESILKNVSAPSQEILLRNLAARTLNLYSQLKSNNDFKISIYYSLSFLNKNDISNRFLLKINDCSIKSEKIILLLNCNDGCLLNQIFKKNINFLKQNKINIHLYNFGSKDIYLLNFVRPKYVTFSKFILENKILYNHLLLLTKKYNIKIIN